MKIDTERLDAILARIELKIQRYLIIWWLKHKAAAQEAEAQRQGNIGAELLRRFEAGGQMPGMPQNGQPVREPS